MQLRSVALTDLGKVRRENQDRLLCLPDLGLYGVADGIGGLPGGAEAAQETVGAVIEGVRSHPKEPQTIVRTANARVSALGRRISPRYGIGSTLTYGVFYDDRLQVVHVGDSRCYRWRKHRLTPITADHSVENELRARLARGESVGEVDERSLGALTRCIGQNSPPELDLWEEAIQEGDRYLFATDGITRAVSDVELQEQLGRAAPAQAILNDLIQLASARGGFDNATGVLVFVEHG